MNSHTSKNVLMPCKDFKGLEIILSQYIWISQYKGQMTTQTHTLHTHPE
jgi:hypothetical protein